MEHRILFYNHKVNKKLNLEPCLFLVYEQITLDTYVSNIIVNERSRIRPGEVTGRIFLSSFKILRNPSFKNI